MIDKSTLRLAVWTMAARAGDRVYALQLLDRISDFELDDHERAFKRSLVRAIEKQEDLEAYSHAVSDLGKSIH